MFDSRITSVLGSVVLGVTIFACSAPVPGALDNGTGGESSPSASTTKTPTKTTTPTTPGKTATPATDDAGTTIPPTTTGAGDGATCKASSGGDEMKCNTCCGGADAAAFKVANDAFLACECAGGSRCASSCGAFCASKNENDVNQACGTCLDSDSSCNGAADQACAADATCAAADTCMATCMGQ